jgi:hypothetical protein
MPTLYPFSFDRVIQAVEAVKARLLKSARLLDAAGIPYAVVGGNAVAAWVARVDIAAVRNTQDVDILIRLEDFAAAREAFEKAGFAYRQILGVHRFLETEQANPRDAVHVVFARQRIKPDDLAETPDVFEREQAEDYWIVKLEALVRMKLTSYRRKDQTHLLDLIGMELIDQSWTRRFQPELAERLQQLLDDPNG